MWSVSVSLVHTSTPKNLLMNRGYDWRKKLTNGMMKPSNNSMNAVTRLRTRTYYTSFFLLVIVLLGAFLRHHNFVSVPRQGATFDEFAWVWQGMNVIQKGIPISWSSQPQYTTREHRVYQGAAFWIVQPYLEHPPAFGIVAGGFALLNGSRDMYDVTLGGIRPLALILGVVSIVLIFFLVRLHYDTGAALLTSLFYAVTPTVAIGSRIVQNENFLIPLWLMALIMLSGFIKNNKTFFRNAAAVAAGIAVLAKVPWIVVGISLIAILAFRKRWRDVLVVLGITGAIGLLYPLYAILLDRELFFSLLALQLNRYDIHFQGLFSQFTKPLLVDRYYLDGWILFGWFSIVLILRDWKKHLFIVIPFLCYLGIYMWGIPDEPAHGWYRYPFIPFLLMGAAVIIREEFKQITMVSLFFVLTVGLALLGNWWTPVFGFSYGVYRVFIGVAAGSMLLPLFFEKKFGRYSSGIVALWICVLILLSFLSVWIFVDG